MFSRMSQYEFACAFFIRPLQGAKVVIAYIILFALVFACSLDGSTTTSFNLHSHHRDLRDDVLGKELFGFPENRNLGDKTEGNAIDEASFLQAPKLKLLKKKYRELKKRFLKAKSKKQFIRLKYTVMVSALEKALEKHSKKH